MSYTFKGTNDTFGLCSDKQEPECIRTLFTSMVNFASPEIFQFVTPFSPDINTLPAKFQMECIEVQSDIQMRSCLFTRPSQTPSDQREALLTSQSHLIQVIAFWL